MARSEVSYNYEEDMAFVAAGTGQTVTASGDLTSRVTLDKMTTARADSELRDKLGAQGYKVVLVLSDVSVANADEGYQFTVEATDAAGANPIQVGEIILPAGTGVAGQYTIGVDASAIEKLGGGVSDVNLNVEVTVSGTTPSVTVAAAWVYLGH